MKLLLVLLASLAVAADPNHVRAVEQYRAQRATELTENDGWLSVVGLFRLKEGENRIGSSEGSEVKLPQAAPAHVGRIQFEKGSAIYFSEEDLKVGLLLEGTVSRTKGPEGRVLKPNLDVIRTGNISFFVIKRGDEFFVRVKDNDSELRKGFTGQKWFPIDPSWKISAKFTTFDQPKTILFDSQNGVKQPMISPGFATFTRDGKEYRLEPVWEEKKLFFIFRDATSNKSTYGAARFLYAEPPKDGLVTLDFNKAINPPCAFTAYATCPLPPPQNRLTLAITAGEKKYSDAVE